MKNQNRKFTIMGSSIGWSGGQYTIQNRATPIEAAHKAARRIWREANKKRIEKPYFNFIMREIGTQRTSSYRAYKEKLSSPKTFIRGGKTIVSNYDYFAKPCGASEFQEPKQQGGGGDEAFAAEMNEYFQQMGGFEEDDVEGDEENEEHEKNEKNEQNEEQEEEEGFEGEEEEGHEVANTGHEDTVEEHTAAEEVPISGGGRRYSRGGRRRR